MRRKMFAVGTVTCIVLVIFFLVWEGTEYFPYLIVQEKAEYGYTLEEVGERLEYVCQLENTLGQLQGRNFGELGSLPQENAVGIQIYLVRGNRILFLPESKANVKMEKDGMTYNAYYSQEREGYLFYVMDDWEAYEAGVPVNSAESSHIMYCMVTDEKNAYIVVECSKKGIDVYDTGELLYLGEMQVDLSAKMLTSLNPIEVKGNAYINDVVECVVETLAREGEYGEYTIYLNEMSRIQRDKTGDGLTHCYMDCVIEGNGRKEYAQFIIYDGNDIDGRVFSLSGPHMADSLGYFSDYYSEDENREYIEKIMKQRRGVVTFKVTEQVKEPVWSTYNEPDYNRNLDFGTMSVEDIARQLSYVCSYSDWFGMTELGSRAGAARGFDGQEVILYPWDHGKGLLFISTDKVNAQLQGEGGELCPVYVNEMGYMEFYQINRNIFADGSGQLDTSMITIREYETQLAKYLVKPAGRVYIKVEDLTKLEMSSVKEDRFVHAFVQHVKEVLAQAEKHGTYTVHIGEYEVLHTNKACISAAVTGEQDAYYIRYLIVGYGDNQYYFWPVGFGIDGSLEECADTKHDMNQTCIERTEQLNRTDIKIDLG